MIPNIQPPPLWLPQGWSPNALRPTPAQLQTTIFGQVLSNSGTGEIVSQHDLSNTQIANGGTTFVPFIAGVAGKIIVPIFVYRQLNIVASWTSAPFFRLKYTTDGGQFFLNQAWSLNGAPQVLNQFDPPSALVFSNATCDPRGQTLGFSLSSNPTGAGTTTARVIIVWSMKDSLI